MYGMGIAVLCSKFEKVKKLYLPRNKRKYRLQTRLAYRTFGENKFEGFSITLSIFLLLFVKNVLRGDLLILLFGRQNAHGSSFEEVIFLSWGVEKLSEFRSRKIISAPLFGHLLLVCRYVETYTNKNKKTPVEIPVLGLEE